MPMNLYQATTNHAEGMLVPFLGMSKYIIHSAVCAYKLHPVPKQSGHYSWKLLEVPGMQFISWKILLGNIETPGKLLGVNFSKYS